MELNVNILYEYALNVIFSGVKLITCCKKLE